MGDDLVVLRRANPIPPDEADGWKATRRAQQSWQRVVEAVESDTVVLEPQTGVPAKPGSSWRIALAGAVVVVLALAVPFWLLGPARNDGATPSAQVAVQLGVEHVWPDGGRSGSAVDVAVAFADEVLGWRGAVGSADPEADPDGPVWVQLRAEGQLEVSVLTVPLPAGGRALLQIGSPPSVGLLEPGSPGGSWISLQPVGGAVSADLSVRLIGAPDSVGFEVEAADLGGRFETSEIDDARRIATILIRYRNAEGTVIAAAGGHYTSDEPLGEALTPQEILSDGVVSQAEYRAAAEAVVDCLRSQGLDASVEFDATGSASFTAQGGDAEQLFTTCHAEHLGSVALVWADQNAPSPEREIAFYNDVVDCVEAQTGESYGDVEAVADTRATDAAIAAAPDLYNACMEQVIVRYPDLGPGR